MKTEAEVDSSLNNFDLVSLLQAGQYDDDIGSNSTWSAGDWNVDGEFDRADLILALQDGGYGQGPRAALAAVPEPAAIVLALAALVCLAAAARGRCRPK